MITLSISHNVYLTDEEISKLMSGEAIKTIGVSVPVWFFKGNTSEPAKEIFCEYLISDIEEDYPVTIIDEGYKINLPKDIDEDSSSWVFKRYNKITEKGKRFNIVHIVEIKKMSILLDSLIS